MNETPSQTKEKRVLERYSRILSTLDLDTQLAIITKETRTEKELTRILGTNAPAELIARFAGQAKAVMSQLPSIDQGRVLIAKRDISKAKAAFNSSLIEGNPKGNFGLATVYKTLDAQHYADKIELYCLAAIAAHEDTDQVRELLAGIYNSQGKNEEAKIEIDHAIANAKSDMDKNYCKGLKAVMLKEGGHLRYFRLSAEQGHYGAIHFMYSHFSKQNNFQEMVKYVLLGIKFGAVEAYNLLGAIYKKDGQKKEAIDAYKKSISAGYFSGCSALVETLIEDNQPEEAVKICQDLIDEDEFEGYKGMMIIASLKDDEKQLFGHIKNAQKKGIELPVAFEVALLLHDNKKFAAINFLKTKTAENPALNFLIAQLYEGKDEGKPFLMEGLRFYKLDSEITKIRSFMEKSKKEEAKKVTNDLNTIIAIIINSVFNDFPASSKYIAPHFYPSKEPKKK